MEPVKNVDLARRTLEHVEALALARGPDRWDQGRFRHDNESCGTTACFAGWAVALTDGHEYLTMSDAEIEDRAAELLGLDIDDVDKIFFNWTVDPRELRRVVEGVFGPLPPADLPRAPNPFASAGVEGEHA